MLVHAGVTLTFVAAQATGGGASFQHTADDLLDRVRQVLQSGAAGQAG
jgi:hypothetical protein